MPYLDSSRPPIRNVLWLFYSSAFLSAIMFSAASYASVSYHKPLLVLALVTAPPPFSLCFSCVREMNANDRSTTVH
jgi:hypothetical protein